MRRPLITDDDVTLLVLVPLVAIWLPLHYAWRGWRYLRGR